MCSCGCAHRSRCSVFGLGCCVHVACLAAHVPWYGLSFGACVWGKGNVACLRFGRAELCCAVLGVQEQHE
jgi:hypothetical protein